MSKQYEDRNREPVEGENDYAYEDDPRKDCPWKCGPDDRNCLCLANVKLNRQEND